MRRPLLKDVKVTQAQAVLLADCACGAKPGDNCWTFSHSQEMKSPHEDRIQRARRLVWHQQLEEWRSQTS